MQVAKVREREGADGGGLVPESTTPNPGSVAISASPEAGWLVVGDKAWVSGADLTAWEKA